MKAFMDKDFLLETATAQHLFHDYSEKLPLVDYHCHLNPKEIYEDRRFENLAQVWLGGLQPDGSFAGDHYKWRVMRSNGTPEEYITGTKPDFERFMKFVEALEMAIGNPMYHWCHLELQQFFGIYEPLTTESAERIWNKCNDLLRNDPEMSARGLIRKANVAFIGTTDDPIDTLEWHEKIAADETIEVVVGPSYRPDKAEISTRPVGRSIWLSWLLPLVRNLFPPCRMFWMRWSRVWSTSTQEAARLPTTAWTMFPMPTTP